MSAGMPGAEAASTFSERDLWRWRRAMGAMCDPLLPADLYPLEHEKGGSCRLGDRTLFVPVCVYVAVDDADACLYIGQCRRSEGGIVERIQGHHAIPTHATGLWLLPVRGDCPNWALDQLEEDMIRAYRPPYNTVFCPPAYRAEVAS